MAAIDSVDGIVGRLPIYTAQLQRANKHPEWYACRSKLPNVELTFRPAVDPSEADVALCERLRAAYLLAATSETVSASDLWDGIIESHHGQLLACLRQEDSLPLARLLSSMFTQSFMWGISVGSAYTELRTADDAVIWELSQLDNLLSLAEALGVVRTENPEQGVTGQAFAGGLDALVSKVERELGVAIGFPDIGAPYGLQIGDSLITPETPEHVYAALRIQRAMRLAGASPNPVVAEIGAGFGGTALRLMQLADIRRYTIVDLPIVNVLQGYFLFKALGCDAVSLFGEPAARLCVWPTHALESVGDVHILVNENSMPEMPAAVVDDYLTWARSHVTEFFFSYNQEAYSPVNVTPQVLVPDAVRRVGGFELVSRTPSWVRRGYVEEIYRPQTMEDPASPTSEHVYVDGTPVSEICDSEVLFERWFGSLAAESPRILHVGLSDARMPDSRLERWHEYMPEARIYGFGTAERSCPKSESIKTFQGDQYCRKDVELLLAEFGGEFDIIIDDDSRRVGEHQPQSLSMLFGQLRSGGQYILQASPSTQQLAHGLERRVGESKLLRMVKDARHVALDLINAGHDKPTFLSRGAITRLGSQAKSVEYFAENKLVRIVKR